MSQPVVDPPSLQQLLTPCREAERDRYLILREAFLSLGGTREEIVRAGRTWLPSLRARGREILRVHLPQPGGRRRGMTLEVSLPVDARAGIETAAELAPRTRARVAASTGSVKLPVRTEDDLAEGLALAMHLLAADGR